MAIIDMSKWTSYRFRRGTRYYALSLVQNLWGEWEIKKTNGSLNTALGKVRHEPCESYEKAQEKIKQYKNHRVIKRHYYET